MRWSRSARLGADRAASASSRAAVARWPAVSWRCAEAPGIPIGAALVGPDRLTEHGVEVLLLDDPGCIALTTSLVAEHPVLWNEDIGEDDDR
mgnify:CR=1 FL=1